MFETQTFDFETQDFKDAKTTAEADLETTRSQCIKAVPVDVLVVKERNNTPSPIRQAVSSPRNVKLFHKARDRRSDGGIAAAELPMIIGGSDLVPHKRRPGQDDDDDDGQEAEPDGDAAFLLSNGKSGAAAKEKQNGGVSRETFASPQAGQADFERTQPSNDGKRRRKAADAPGIGGPSGAEGGRTDNAVGGESPAKRPRRNIVSMF